MRYKGITIHGHCRVGHRTKEYSTWAKMIGRCYCLTDKAYYCYGARGISVCDRWRYSFASFLKDMGLAPSPSHSIGRINNNGNYEPKNCRWETRKQQCLNKSNNRYLAHKGKRMTISEWADYLRIPRRTLYNRIDAGLPVHLALRTTDRRSVPRSEQLCHIR